MEIVYCQEKGEGLLYPVGKKDPREIIGIGKDLVKRVRSNSQEMVEEEVRLVLLHDGALGMAFPISRALKDDVAQALGASEFPRYKGTIHSSHVFAQYYESEAEAEESPATLLFLQREGASLAALMSMQVKINSDLSGGGYAAEIILRTAPIFQLGVIVWPDDGVSVKHLEGYERKSGILEG